MIRAFLEAFRLSATIKTGEFPPAALVELYYEPEASTARLRRLHLVIVDLLLPRKFFLAHAVRARSSDGHKNVLSLIGYSHLLENR